MARVLIPTTPLATNTPIHIYKIHYEGIKKIAENLDISIYFDTNMPIIMRFCPLFIGYFRA